MSDELDVFEVMHTARAVRRYRPDPVPDELLAECLEAATWAPSGSNRQGWRFVVIRSPEVMGILGPAYRRGWEAKAAEVWQGAGGENSDTPRARAARTMRHFVDHFEETPACVLFCLRGRGRPPLLYDGASVYPAMQNFLLAARARGLGAAITMWFFGCERELREAIGIPDDYLLAALVTVGWPAGRHGPVARKPLSEVAYRDRWGEPLTGPSTGAPASR